MKKRMNRIVCMAMALLMACAALTSCGNAKAPEAADSTPQIAVSNPTPGGKFVIHFEGRVTAVDGDRVTLDNGKIVILDGNTVYTDANGAAAKSAVCVGAYIQGSTADDPVATQITAKRIHITGFVSNPVPSGKFTIHFEGRVTAVEGDRITLDNGKVITVNEDTVYTTPSGAAEKSALRVGDYIQGSTADDPAAAVVSAKRIHIVVF